VLIVDERKLRVRCNGLAHVFLVFSGNKSSAVSGLLSGPARWRTGASPRDRADCRQALVVLSQSIPFSRQMRDPDFDRKLFLFFLSFEVSVV
jgi:hypothetical protein